MAQPDTAEPQRTTAELRPKQAVQQVEYRHATPDTVDYRGHFSLEQGQEFLDTVFGLPGTPEINGKELLTFLMTPKAVDPFRLPKEDYWEGADFSQLGKTELELWEFLESKTYMDEQGEIYRFPRSFAGSLFRQIESQGLYYCLREPGTGRSFYGVPPHVRNALELTCQGVDSPESMSDTERSAEAAFIDALNALAEMVSEALAHPDSDLAPPLAPGEFGFELAAQILLAAMENGLLSRPDLLAGLEEQADQLRLIAPTTFTDIPDLLIECKGTALENAVQDLKEAAIRAGYLSQDGKNGEGDW